jgi:hypothetical protein
MDGDDINHRGLFAVMEQSRELTDQAWMMTQHRAMAMVGP